MPPLPFDRTANVTIQGGEVVAQDVAVAVWALPSSRETSAGEVYDWTGQADVAAAGELVDQVNRMLLVDDRRLKVISAIRHDFVPHVELRLREMKQGG